MSSPLKKIPNHAYKRLKNILYQYMYFIQNEIFSTYHNSYIMYLRYTHQKDLHKHRKLTFFLMPLNTLTPIEQFIWNSNQTK